MVNWMMSINNGQFLAYEKDLRRTLKAMNFLGEYLEDVDNEELRTFGVKRFRDSRTLEEHIQYLVKGKTVPKGDKLEYEGEVLDYGSPNPHPPSRGGRDKEGY